MKEIDAMLSDSSEDRNVKIEEMKEKVQQMLEEPYKEFEDEYSKNILSLSAKDGLGKVYGQPRRLA